MPDDVLPITDIAVANLVGACEGIWDSSSGDPWKATWTVPAGVALALDIAECCADIAVPFDLL